MEAGSTTDLIMGGIIGGIALLMVTTAVVCSALILMYKRSNLNIISGIKIIIATDGSDSCLSIMMIESYSQAEEEGGSLSIH